MMVSPLAKEGSESMTLTVAGATSNAASFLIATGSGSSRTSTSLKWVMLLLMLLLLGVRKETEPREDLLRADAPLEARRIDAGEDMVAGVVAAVWCLIDVIDDGVVS
jgi:hypothetical protein